MYISNKRTSVFGTFFETHIAGVTYQWDPEVIVDKVRLAFEHGMDRISVTKRSRYETHANWHITPGNLEAWASMKSITGEED